MSSKEDYLKFMSEVRKVSGVDTLTPDGTELERDVLQLGVRKEMGLHDILVVSPGSKLTFGHTLWIPAAEFDRLAEQDFTAYNDNAV
jgi:hypothetical protein